MKNPDAKWLLFVPVLVIYIAGMFIDIMEVDAAQYAAMSLEMIDTGNYLELYYRGEDYIDKPPLIFWTAALSFKIFGVSNFSYKLPSLLFTLLGIFATYRLGRTLYNERTGFCAALTLATCQAWFLINQDVRTDAMLAACTILGIWQLVEYNRDRKIVHILLSGIGIAGAMLTKGPIGLMVPALALGTDFVLKRNWRGFLQWQWILLLLVVLILLLPMMYGLYTQYDLSSGGKQTYNGVITSGLRFYFWTQSFGRLTGESTWQNETDPFFFVHTFLWSFLPWSVFFVVAFWDKVKEILSSRFRFVEPQEAITFGGILFPLIAFSLSRYKLPHYIYVFFPLVAILTGALIDRLITAGSNWRFGVLRRTHDFVATALVSFGFVLSIVSFPPVNLYVLFVAGVGACCVLYFVLRGKSPFKQLVMPSLLAILTVDFLLNFHMYPSLLRYQSESVVSQTVRASPFKTLAALNVRSFSLDFYYRKHVPIVINPGDLLTLYPSQKVWVFTNQAGYDAISSTAVFVTEKKIIEDIHVSTLTPEFLNPSTRGKALRHNYLLLVDTQ